MTSDASMPPADRAITVVAIAILQAGDRFLMQLRDDIPGIVYPGCWGMFGGHAEPGETPDETIRRELVEEIGHAPAVSLWCDRFPHPHLHRFVFAGPLDVPLARLALHEGWDLGLLSVADVERGYGFSAVAGGDRPIAAPHRQLLWEYLHRR